jgi:hypothetical protein
MRFYSALAVVLLVIENIGVDGDDREGTPSRSYIKETLLLKPTT